MLYGTLTYTFTIDFLIRHITKEETEFMDPVARTAIRMAVWQIQFGNNIPAYAAVDASVEITKKYNHKASGYVNAVLRKFAEAPEAKRYLDQFKPGIRVALKPEIYGVVQSVTNQDVSITSLRDVQDVRVTPEDPSSSCLLKMTS